MKPEMHQAMSNELSKLARPEIEKLRLALQKRDCAAALEAFAQVTFLLASMNAHKISANDLRTPSDTHDALAGIAAMRQSVLDCFSGFSIDRPKGKGGTLHGCGGCR